MKISIAIIFLIFMFATIFLYPRDIGIELEFYCNIGDTRIYRANLRNSTVKRIKLVIINDSGRGGGGGGTCSGFDIDFLLFDLDGDLNTELDQVKPVLNDETFVSAGAILSVKNANWLPTLYNPGILFGLSKDKSINYKVATLGTRDAVIAGKSTGWVSLGDTGTLQVRFPDTLVDDSRDLYFFIGEVGVTTKEVLAAKVIIIEK